MIQPRYILAPRLVGRLALGELAVEPALGMARVIGVRHAEGTADDGSVVVRWMDENGPCTASGRYPADRSLLVTMPALADRLLVRRGIDQASWNRCTVSHDIARLIASHLHAGSRSALHRFVLDGGVAEEIYDELEDVARNRLYAREWVDALVRYCLGRNDSGPAWARQVVPTSPAQAVECLAFAGVKVESLQRSGDERADLRRRYRALLTRKQISTEMAARLIDSAFLLGTAFARRRRLIATVEDRLRNR